MFSYDKPGAAHQNVNALASYTYRLYISPKYKFSLGLAAGIMNRSYNPRKLHLDLSSDPGMFMKRRTA